MNKIVERERVKMSIATLVAHKDTQNPLLSARFAEFAISLSFFSSPYFINAYMEILMEKGNKSSFHNIFKT